VDNEVVTSLIDSMDRYASDHIDALAIDAAKDIPRHILTDLAEMGMFSLSIPEEWGGAGFGLGSVCEVVTALARHDRSVATTVGLHLGLGTRGLIAFANDAQKERYLPVLASGEKIAAFSATEPNAGSDLAAIATRAVRKGDRLKVDGTKVYVTNGSWADVFTIVADTFDEGGQRVGHSVVVLEGEDAGLGRGAEEGKLGLRGSSTITVNLDEMDIPGDRLVGVPGKGLEYIHHILAWGRTAMAAGCLGTADAAITKAVFQVHERKQFGRELAEFEVVQDQMSRMNAERFAMGALVHRVGACPAEELIARSTAAKVFCSDGAWGICDTSLQLHGGAGFIEEMGVALLLRDARITRIFEGANDVLTVHMGTMEFGVPLPRTALVTALSDNGLTRRADALAERIASRKTALWERYKMRVMRQQLHVHQLGQLAILREATDAAVLRAAELGTPEALASAEAWITIAERRANPLLELVPIPPK